MAVVVRPVSVHLVAVLILYVGNEYLETGF